MANIEAQNPLQLIFLDKALIKNKLLVIAALDFIKKKQLTLTLNFPEIFCIKSYIKESTTTEYTDCVLCIPLFNFYMEIHRLVFSRFLIFAEISEMLNTFRKSIEVFPTKQQQIYCIFETFMTSICEKKILAEVRLVHAEQISLYNFIVLRKNNRNS